jgi:hypothetical protein
VRFECRRSGKGAIDARPRDGVIRLRLAFIAGRERHSQITSQAEVGECET